MPTPKLNSETLYYPPKPLSSYAKGAGLTRRRMLGNIKWNILRENFEISTWLAMGACLQCLLFSLPIASTFAMGPASIFLGLKILKTFLVWQKLLPNPRAWDLLSGGNGPVQLYSIPEGASTANRGKAEYSELPGNDEICVLLAGGYCNHPFGHLAPAYNLDNLMDGMVRDLEKNAATNGFLGATSWINTSAYTSGNQTMTLFYFRSKKDLNTFYTRKAHQVGADDWYKKKVHGGGHGDYIGLFNESWVSGKGQWDNFSRNVPATMFNGTTYLVEGDDGVIRWERAHAKPVMSKGKGGSEFPKRHQLFKNAKKPDSKEK